MNRLLMISYAYPPMGSPGALRVAKLAKYLPAFGWAPVVVTPDKGYCKTQGLEDHVDLPSVHVYRTADLGFAKRAVAKATSKPGTATLPSRSRHFLQWLAIPDRNFTWLPSALRAGRRAIRETRPLAIFSTFSGATNHLVAQRLSRQYNIPWIADFRDLWTTGDSYPWKGVRAKLERHWESQFLANASWITVVSEGMKRSLSETHACCAEKIVVLRNGFDHEDFENADRTPRDGCYRLCYSGMFYGGKRDVSPVLQAIANLKSKGQIDRTTFQFEIIGVPEPHVIAMIDRFHIDELVQHVGYLSYNETIARLVEASALLLIESGQGNMTTKFYEYLASGRPIVAFTTLDHEMVPIIKRLEAGRVFAPDNVQGFEEWLMREIQSSRDSNSSMGARWNEVQEFSRVAGAEKLSQLLTGLVTD